MEESNDDLYTNLLKATDNLQDIVFSRYATVTDISNGKYTLKELNSELVHNNVPSLSTDIKKGDTVLLSFTDNSLHNPLIIASTSPTNLDEFKIISMGCGLFKIKNRKLYVELPVGMENPFSINENGVLCVELPEGASNDYSIREDGMLIYKRDD